MHPTTNFPKHSHDPSALLHPLPASQPNRIAIILNAPITDFQLLRRVWRNCAIRVCADGGANRLYDFLREREDKAGLDGVDRRDSNKMGGERVENLLPTHIHGDLDSLRPDVRDFYKSRGVAVTQDGDQYSTDFGKAMKKAAEAYVALVPSPASAPNSSNGVKRGKENGHPRTQPQPEMGERDAALSNMLDGYLNAWQSKSGWTSDALTMRRRQEEEAEAAAAAAAAYADVDGAGLGKKSEETNNHVDLIILGTLSGRIDHGIGLLHEMLREQRPETSVFLETLRKLREVDASKSAAVPAPASAQPKFVHPAASVLPEFMPSQPDTQTQVPQTQNTGPITLPTTTLTLLSESSLSFLLLPSSHNTIHYSPIYLRPTIGILPVYGPARITTKGLKWDVDGWETRMGGQVSTSNRIDVGEDSEEDGGKEDGTGEQIDGKDVEAQRKGCNIINEPSAESADGQGEGRKGNYLLFTIERRTPFSDSDSSSPQDTTSQQQKKQPKPDPAGEADWWGSVMGRWQGGPGGGMGMGMGGAGDDYASTSSRWTDVGR